MLMPGEFYGEVLNKHDGCGLVLSEFTHNRARKIPKHSHELGFFNLILDGSYCESFTRKTAVLKRFTTIFHPPGIEHRDEIGGDGMRVFSVELRDHWFVRLREYGVIPESAVDPRGGELTWLAMRLYREFRERNCSSALSLEGLVLEMLAVLDHVHETIDKRPPVWLPRLLDLLNASFQQNLTVSFVAREIGVHPVYLTRVFRRYYHQTIGDYLHKLRIEFALRELKKPAAELAAIATAAGFSDQSHFTRVFKDITGMTPGAYRSISGLPKRENRKAALPQTE
jgi:AraC family transcriptional regulator